MGKRAVMHPEKEIIIGKGKKQKGFNIENFNEAVDALKTIGEYIQKRDIKVEESVEAIRAIVGRWGGRLDTIDDEKQRKQFRRLEEGLRMQFRQFDREDLIEKAGLVGKTDVTIDETELGTLVPKLRRHKTIRSVGRIMEEESKIGGIYPDTLTKNAPGAAEQLLGALKDFGKAGGKCGTACMNFAEKAVEIFDGIADDNLCNAFLVSESSDNINKLRNAIDLLRQGKMVEFLRQTEGTGIHEALTTMLAEGGVAVLNHEVLTLELGVKDVGKTKLADLFKGGVFVSSEFLLEVALVQQLGKKIYYDNKDHKIHFDDRPAEYNIGLGGEAQGVLTGEFREIKVDIKAGLAKSVVGPVEEVRIQDFRFTGTIELSDPNGNIVLFDAVRLFPVLGTTLDASFGGELGVSPYGSLLIGIVNSDIGIVIGGEANPIKITNEGKLDGSVFGGMQIGDWHFRVTGGIGKEGQGSTGAEVGTLIPGFGDMTVGYGWERKKGPLGKLKDLHAAKVTIDF